MRIALLSAEYPPQPGGVGDYTRRLGEALAYLGHGVNVLTIVDCRFQISDLGSGTPNLQTTIYNLQSAWGWGSWRAVIAALERIRPDVLHIQYQTGAYAMRPAINLLPWRLRGLPGRPALVVTAHDLLLPYLFPKAGPLRRWVTRRLLADADAAIFTNEADCALAAGRWPWRGYGVRGAALIPIGSNIAVAPPAGYERAAWRARLGVAPDETLVAYFGLISRTKGLDMLLDALARLPARFRLLVIGGAATAPEDRAFAAAIRDQIAALGLGERVTITGHCAADEVSAHLLAADLAALPFADGASFRRGSLLAAMAHGVPTITTFPAGGATGTNYRLSPIAHRQLADGENALLVPPGEPQSLARAIGRLAQDADLRVRLAADGRALAAQFDWRAIAARHEALYAGNCSQLG